MTAPSRPHLHGVVTAQLGRPPRGRWEVAAWCPHSYPAVIETDPYLDDGTPFPTLLYLTCPVAVEAVSRVEGTGGVEDFRRRIALDAEFASEMGALEAAYRLRRRQKVRSSDIDRMFDKGKVLELGIGGTAGPAEAACLHAFVAAVLGLTAAEPDQHWKVAWEAMLADLPRLWCEDARCSCLGPGDAARRAAVDVGTNSVRLLVALVGKQAGLTTLVRRAQITRLGSGLGLGGALGPDAKRRTREVVGSYVAEARGMGAESIQVVGTSACRRAVDGRDFVRTLGEALRVEARVISGEEEAALSYAGAVYDLDGDAVVVDVGGGSTELVRSASPRGSVPDGREDAASPTRPLDVVSVGLGCVQATEAWFTTDPPSVVEREALRRHARDQMAPFIRHFGQAMSGTNVSGSSAGAPGDLRLGPRVPVGVGGTVATIACIVLGLQHYDPGKVHLRRLTRDELQATQDRLAALSPDARAAVPCMQEGRAPVILAGGEILLGVMETLGWEELTFSERDLLDGVVLAASEREQDASSKVDL